MDRIRIFQITIVMAAALIILRLAYWQFFANTNSVADEFLNESEIPAARGEIYTSDGFPLVANQEAFLLYAKPQETAKDAKNIAQKIAPDLVSEKYATASAQLSDDEKKAKDAQILVKEESLAQKLSRSDLIWVQLARKIPLAIKEKIESLKFVGLGFERDEKRFYSEASMAAQLVGFVGFDKFGNDTGYFGLEGYWDKKLRGKNGRLGEERDPLGLPILVGNYRRVPPKRGDSLYLSIDRPIQFMVEGKLRAAVEKYGAKDGTVIIADPKTGRILSMATYPSYDPNLRQEYDEKLYRNPAVADTFEPGSIFKVIAMSAALDTDSVMPSTKCPKCSGPVEIGGFEISTWNKKYYPESTMTEIIEHSDNVGMSYVSEKMGKDKFYDYITKFGFGKLTDIDLQEEAVGSVRPKSEWRPIDLATASFGQGIAVTPIQMVQSVGAIANGGKLISPKVVEKVKEGDNFEENKPETVRQVIKPETASQITEMMVNAVEKGEARAFVPKGYRIAGKTGTAQIPIAGHYDPNKTIASFVGFAPANDPKFVMMVRFNQPSSSPFGSETAAPTFFSIAKELFNYWGILPKD